MIPQRKNSLEKDALAVMYGARENGTTTGVVSRSVFSCRSLAPKNDTIEKLHLRIKVGANIMVAGVPGQEGAKGNVAEKNKVKESMKVSLGKLLKYNALSTRWSPLRGAIYRTEVCTEMCTCVVYPNKVVSEPDRRLSISEEALGAFRKSQSYRDKEVNMAARDYDGALVYCIENTIDDRIMDLAASFHATYCKEELERFKQRLDKHQRLDDMSRIGMSMLASKGNVLDVQKAYIYFCKPGGLGKQKNLSFIMSVKIRKLQMLESCDRYNANLQVKCLKFGAIYRTEVCTEMCTCVVYPNKVVSEPDRRLSISEEALGAFRKSQSYRDKEVNMAARDYDGALVYCIENTIDDRIMDLAASFHATYCKEELERFKQRLDKHQRLDDMSRIGMSMLASKGNVLDVQKAYIYFCKPGGLGKQKNLSFIMSVKIRKLQMLESCDRYNANLQFGVAERLSQTFRAESMGLRAKALKILWAGSVSTTYLIYRIPYVLIGLRIPEEEWRGKYTSLAYLKVFGCESFVKVKDVCGEAMKCTFIGSGSNEMRYSFQDTKSQQNDRIVVEYGLSSEITESPGGSSNTSEGSKNCGSFEDSEISDEEYSKDGASCKEGGSQTPHVRRSTKESKAPWKKAINEEMVSLEKNQTCSLVRISAGKKASQRLWMFKLQKPSYVGALNDTSTQHKSEFDSFMQKDKVDVMLVAGSDMAEFNKPKWVLIFVEDSWIEEPCNDVHRVGDEREVEVFCSFNWPPSELITDNGVLPKRSYFQFNDVSSGYLGSKVS
nr:hypothetical protein [Tanacetum cinerariifolium]